MWRDDANPDSQIEQYATLLEKEVPSRGSFEGDFEAYLSNLSIIRCPFIKSSPSSGDLEQVSAKNARVDKSNWRAMLLACISVGSKVKDILIHGCSLTHQHILDLSAASAKFPRPISVTIQYCTFSDLTELTEQYADAFALLFQESIGIDFISLKGNNLSDAHLHKAVANISGNQRLKAIALPNNQLTNEFALSLLNGLKLQHTLQGLSLAGNLLSVAPCLKQVLEYHAGTPVNPADDASIKALTKAIGDKNKGIKDLNKKRKKAGLPDVDEIPALPEFVKTIDGQKLFVNSSLKFVDFSEGDSNGTDLSDTIRSVGGVQRVADGGLKVYLSAVEGASADEFSWLVFN